MLYVLLAVLMWLLPAVLCWLIVFDGQPVRSSGFDRRILLALGLSLVLETLLWYAFSGTADPISLGLKLKRRTATYQTLIRWSAAMACSIPMSLLLGMGIRSVKLVRGGVAVVRRPVSRSVRGVVLLIASTLVLGLMLSAYYGAQGARLVRIQEFCRKEQSAEGDVGFVVLRNDGGLSNAPQGLFLSADEKDLRQYRLADVTIAPGETERLTEESARFLDVSKSGGQTVYLSDGLGHILDTVDLPALPTDTSLRWLDGEWAVYDLTRDMDLNDAVSVSAPTFSAKGGFYDSEFSLTLTAPAGCEIHYTLDSSTPNGDSPVYRSPIRIYDPSAEANRYRAVQNVRANYLDYDPIGTEPVEKAMVVRAVAVDAVGNCSSTVTETYFVGREEADTQRTVISLVADPEVLFGEDGIYVTGSAYETWYAAKREAERSGKKFNEPQPPLNFMARGMDAEREGNFELYDAGSAVVNQAAGLRLQGNTGRVGVLKRFSVYARSIYSGSSRFSAPLFPGRETHSIALRSGFDNAFCHQLAAGRDVAVLPVRPVRVFLNGEFWYDTYMLEKYCGTYFAETFGVSKDDVELVDIGSWNMLGDAERSAYEQLLKFVADHDMSDPENYAALCRIADMQSYIDYACLNVILGNADSHEKMNMTLWRTKVDELSTYGDGRWRWALNDMDLNRSYNLEHSGAARVSDINSFTASRSSDWPALLSGGTFYEGVKASEAFREQFVLTFMDLINTTFHPDNTGALLASMGKDLSYDDSFYRDRPEAITACMAEEFGLEGEAGEVHLTVSDNSAGRIRINTITPELGENGWSGKYYSAYPVTLTAQTFAGYAFDHWEINGERMDEPTIRLPITEKGVNVHAVFR